MALRGEGDPRWVVRERQDGRNVNGWHWEDKNVSEWAQTRLKALISSSFCRTPNPAPGVAVSSVETVEGDATLYNRKGVLKVLYDLKISGRWSSLHEADDEKTYGDFKIDLFDDEPDVVLSFDAKSKSDSSFKNAFSKSVSPLIVSQCAIFIKEMHEGAGQSMEGVTVPVQKKTTKKSEVTHYSSAKDSVSKPTSKKANLTELVLHETFTCGTNDWYIAMTDAPRLSAVTRSKVISEARVGGRFNWLNGVVVGEYTKLEPGKELEMRWRLKNWGDDAQPGVARITMSSEDGKTEVIVRINGVPKEHESTTEGFWRVQIFQAMKIVMGWGSASKFM